MNKYDIAVIPGDGIGKEVVPAALHVLDSAQLASPACPITFRSGDY